MRLVAHQDLDRRAGDLQCLSDAAGALVGAEDHADPLVVAARDDPAGDLLGAGRDHALHLGGADIACVLRRIERATLLALLGRVVARGPVRAHCQRPHLPISVLKELSPQLRHQSNRRAQHHRQLAGPGQALDDPQRHAGLAGPAREDDPAPRLAPGQAARVRLGVLAQEVDAALDRLALHARSGLDGVAVAAVRAVHVVLAGVARSLRRRVGGQVDELDRPAANLDGAQCRLVERRRAVGRQPPRGEEVVRGARGELGDLVLADLRPGSVGIEPPSLALDRDGSTVGAPHGHKVDADVLVGRVREEVPALGPVGPLVARFDVPVSQQRGNLGGQVLQPPAVAGERGPFLQRPQSIVDDCPALASRQPQVPLGDLHRVAGCALHGAGVGAHGVRE